MIFLRIVNPYYKVGLFNAALYSKFEAENVSFLSLICYTTFLCVFCTVQYCISRDTGSTDLDTYHNLFLHWPGYAGVCSFLWLKKYRNQDLHMIKQKKPFFQELSNFQAGGRVLSDMAIILLRHSEGPNVIAFSYWCEANTSWSQFLLSCFLAEGLCNSRSTGAP